LIPNLSFSRKYIVILAFLFPGIISCGNRDNSTPESSKLSPVIISKIDKKEMILIPAGEFVMGTNKTDPENTHQKIGSVKPLYLDQQPERKIKLDQYYIDKYEVTNREYKLFIDSTQYADFPTLWQDGTYPADIADHPVTNITWSEAMAFALWAGKTLPTEVQWEKAARGPDGNIFPWGNEFIKGKANMGKGSIKTTMAVGSNPGDTSAYDVFDLAGNVMEWTQDWYQPYPGSQHKSQRFGKKFKVLRGNSFQKGGHYFLEAYQFAFYRTEADPNDYFENVGFRCVYLPEVN
jgi:serine/threonine-protein kinase